MATSGKKQRKTVYCANCAYFLLLKGMNPICVATSKYVRGPIREIIDIEGFVSAERRNKHNNCKYYKRFWAKGSVKKKQWVMKKFWQRDVPVEQMTLRDYQLQIEKQRKEKFVHGRKKTEPAEGVEDAQPVGKYIVDELLKRRLEEIQKELNPVLQVSTATAEGEEEADSRRDSGEERGGEEEAADGGEYFDGLSEEEKRSLLAEGSDGSPFIKKHCNSVDKEAAGGAVEGESGSDRPHSEDINSDSGDGSVIKQEEGGWGG